MGKITSKSTMWESLNSWWIFLSYMCLAWAAFFYIGSRAKKKVWVILGGIYLFLFIILMGLYRGYEEHTIFFMFYVAFFISGIILSYKFKKEYLIRLEMLQERNINQIEYEDFQEQIAKEFAEKGISVGSSEQIEVFKDIVPKEDITIENSSELEDEEIYSSKNSAPIDINSCSIESLSKLPGITLILAKKAVNYRKNNNGFASVEEFYKVVDLKPHFIAQISDSLICNPPAEKASTADDTQIGRSLDL